MIPPMSAPHGRHRYPTHCDYGAAGCPDPFGMRLIPTVKGIHPTYFLGVGLEAGQIEIDDDVILTAADQHTR